MKQKRHSVEEIIRILREVDNGRNVEIVCRKNLEHITSADIEAWLGSNIAVLGSPIRLAFKKPRSSARRGRGRCERLQSLRE
jgi:hypothetical protein